MSHYPSNLGHINMAALILKDKAFTNRIRLLNALISKTVLASGLVLFLYASPAAAEETRGDILRINVGQQGSAVMMPSKWESKSDVEAQFGQPVGRYQPVGTPPITRWVFDRFTVYFEYDHVIHAVAHHQATSDEP